MANKEVLPKNNDPIVVIDKETGKVVDLTGGIKILDKPIRLNAPAIPEEEEEN